MTKTISSYSINKQLIPNHLIKELNVSQGYKQNIDGYYFPNKQLLTKVMRPSELFNTIVDNF